MPAGQVKGDEHQRRHQVGAPEPIAPLLQHTHRVTTKHQVLEQRRNHERVEEPGTGRGPAVAPDEDVEGTREGYEDRARHDANDRTAYWSHQPQVRGESPTEHEPDNEEDWCNPDDQLRGG